MTDQLYYIQGNHPESDSTWIEGEDPLPIEELFVVLNSLPEIDRGIGYYSIRRYGTNEEVENLFLELDLKYDDLPF